MLADALHVLAVEQGQLRTEALGDRPNFSDVGWPGRAVRADPGDVLAEGLSLAANLDRSAACELLLDRGADPGRGPLYGLTPLHFAASIGHLDVATLLVRRGAPLAARDWLHDGTPLDWALHNGHRDDRLVRLRGGG